VTVGPGVIELTAGRRFLWTLAWPVRAYMRFFPLQRGKGVLLRNVILPILGDEATFDAPLPPGGSVRLRASETIGWAWLVYGSFERAELAYASERAGKGGWVFDVGGNVGVFSVSVAQFVSPGARVVAFEPLPGNVSRLRENLERSGLGNVDIVQVAAASAPGEADLLAADDAAYSGLVASVEAGRQGRVVRVPLATIDSVWASRGSPPVSLMKLDIEGGELEALRGATALLEHCHPTLMVEAATDAHIASLEQLLAPFGYEREHPPGFEPWNHVFRVARARS
jgi:FkbM family methyltransferase